MVDITIGQIAESVFIYLGIPFIAGLLTARSCWLRVQGLDVVRPALHPQDQPDHPGGPALHHRGHVRLKGELIVRTPAGRAAHRHPAADLLRGDVPGELLDGQTSGRTTPRRATLSFTAASNNFELAIAVAVAVFGITHGAAFAAVIGPLVEVPVLIGLVNVSLWLKRRFFRGDARELASQRVRIQ